MMDKKVETTIVYWGNIGIIERIMETTIQGLKIWGFKWLHRDNGKENGNYYNGVI